MPVQNFEPYEICYYKRNTMVTVSEVGLQLTQMQRDTGDKHTNTHSDKVQNTALCETIWPHCNETIVSKNR